jgi:hypothetical protein
VKFTRLVIRAAMTAALCIPAALPAQALPDAKTLMEKHNEASGGRAALDKHTSMKQTATVTLPQFTASVEIFRAKPDKFLSKTNLGAMGEVLEGFDGKVGWNSNPMGAQLAEGEMLDIMKGNADFFANFEDHARYTKAETVELTQFEGRPCFKVRLTRGTRNATEYFDVLTGLRAGLVVENQVGGSVIESTTIFSEYTDFGGLKLPKRIVSRANTGSGATIVFTGIEFDKVDPNVFELPASVKALLKP